MFPIDSELAGSNVANSTLLKTLGPWGGLYVVSSLIQVSKQLWCGQRKGAFWGLFRQMTEQSVC